MVQSNPVQTDNEGAIEGVRIKGVSAPGGGGVLCISSDRDDQRIFLGLKSLISGFFLKANFGEYFFG